MKNISLKKLFKNAQNEQAPTVDVAVQVLSAISGMSPQIINPYRAYVWVGAASAVAACILLTVSLFMQPQPDAVNEMMSYVSWVTQ